MDKFVSFALLEEVIWESDTRPVDNPKTLSQSRVGGEMEVKQTNGGLQKVNSLSASQKCKTKGLDKYRVYKVLQSAAIHARSTEANPFSYRLHNAQDNSFTSHLKDEAMMVKVSCLRTQVS